MSCYIVAQVTIHDWDLYKQYQSGFLKMFGDYDGEVLAVDDSAELVEGEWPATRTAIIKFPSKDEAQRWYHSDAYQEITRNFRLPSSNSNIVLLKGFD